MRHNFLEKYPRSRTLVYGLQFKWANQVHTLHIFLFFARRVLMALFLVYGSRYAYWGIHVMIASCILMLWILFNFNQWRDKIVTVQHIVNELFFYVLCWMLLIFQGAFPRIDETTYKVLGYLMIGLLAAFILFNLIVIIWDGIIMHCVWHCRRRAEIVKFR